MPVYPKMFLASNVEGEVRLAVPVSAAGVPESRRARVLLSTNEIFTSSVRQAVATWHFESARRRDRAVSDTVIVAFAFRIRDTPPCPPPPRDWRPGEPQPAQPALPPPVVDFDASRLRGQILACRTHVQRAVLY
jgi:hypothetical protein